MPSDSSFLVTVIGRGNSGTRVLAHTLVKSGVFMGDRLNHAGDKLPPEAMYEACSVLARHVRLEGDEANPSWNFDDLHTMPIDRRFEERIRTYLADVVSSRATRRGWKLPETTLAYPWIVRMFPEARFIHIVRDPRDGLLGYHTTDDLTDFGVPCPHAASELDRRVVSWRFQHQIVMKTPKPEHFLSIRFEDLVLEQERTLGRLEEFLEMELVRIPVKREPVGRWKRDPRILPLAARLAPEMRECGYLPLVEPSEED